MEKIELGIIGATGMAGRAAIKHQAKLDEENENYAELTVVTGSQNSAGKTLGEVFREKEGKLSDAYSFWEENKVPEKYADMEVEETDVETVAEKADYVISALPSSVAREVEPKLREEGVHVFSNASEFRWKENIPLMIPEVNPGHLELVYQQGTIGKQVNNPNCTTAGYVPAINALEQQGLEIKNLQLVTLQAISGKGDKVAEEDYRQKINGNAIEDWGRVEGQRFNGEERKSEIEPQKILGKARNRDNVIRHFEAVRNGEVEEPEAEILPISAQTNRVASQYGHLEAITVEFQKEVSVREFEDAIKEWEPAEEVRDLPSTPENSVKLVEGKFDPKSHVMDEDGMAVIIGRVRKTGSRRISFHALSHNLRRGATWTARQSLELFLKERKSFEF